MSNLSIRCQRLSSLSSQRLNISEVLEVMQEHDLMDLLRVKTDGDLDQLTYTLSSSATIAGRSRLYSTLHTTRDKQQFNFEEPEKAKDERSSSIGSKSTSLDLFPNIAAISSTDEIDIPKDDNFEDETKANPQNGNSLGLFGGISAMLSSKRLSTSKKEKDDVDVKNVEASPVSTGPEKKSFLQRAFGFMTSEPNPISDPEDDDIESGVAKRNSRTEKQNLSTAETTSPIIQNQTRPPTQQQNSSQSRNIVQPPPRNQPPPPSAKQNVGPSPPRPHSVSHTPKPAVPTQSNKPATITDDMKRRHSIATSRALAQEALKVAQARKTSLNERVAGSKNYASTPAANNLTFDDIYTDQGTSKEEVIIETNNQIVGLNRHRESEVQRQNRMSQGSVTVSIAEGDDDSEDEKDEDQFSSQSNPMMKAVTVPPTSQQPPTNLRGLLAGSSGQQDLDFEPDNSAKSLEKRRRSTRFPSIKGKREMFLLRSETGSSVGSNSDQQSGITKKTSESQGTGEGSGLSGTSNTSPVTVESALSRRISRKYVTATTNSEDFGEKVTKFYSYNELKRPTLLKSSSGDAPTGAGDEEGITSLPSDVNPKFREQYLSDQEFEAIFNMSKSAFNAQPKWKKQELKKRHNLF